MSDIDAKLARCEHHVADLALRIAELKETSTGTGSLASTAIIAMLQGTLDSWQEHKRILVGALEVPEAESPVFGSVSHL
jgi:hypothetical protein